MARKVPVRVISTTRSHSPSVICATGVRRPAFVDQHIDAAEFGCGTGDQVVDLGGVRITAVSWATVRSGNSSASLSRVCREPAFIASR